MWSCVTQRQIAGSKQQCRLQLKRGLFWYRHHPNMHEMVSVRSSRAETWTDLRKISMRVFFNSKKCGKMIIWYQKTQTCSFSWTNFLRSYTGPTKVGKNNLSDIIELLKSIKNHMILRICLTKIEKCYNNAIKTTPLSWSLNNDNLRAGDTPTTDEHTQPMLGPLGSTT